MLQAPALRTRCAYALASAALWLAGATATPDDYRPGPARLALALRRAALRMHCAELVRDARVWRLVALAEGPGSWLGPHARHVARAGLGHARSLRRQARAAYA